MQTTSSGTIRFGPFINLQIAHIGALVVSVVSILIFPPFGFLLLVCSILSIGFVTGTEVNFDASRYRTYYSFAGIAWGDWKPLPEIDYIAIVRKKQKVRIYRRQVMPGRTFYGTAQTVGYSNDINLIFKDSPVRYLTLTSVPLKKAYRISKHLSNLLNIRVLDSSSANVTWMEN